MSSDIIRLTIHPDNTEKTIAITTPAGGNISKPISGETRYTLSCIDDRAILSILVAALKEIANVGGAFKANLVARLAEAENRNRKSLRQKPLCD